MVQLQMLLAFVVARLYGSLTFNLLAIQDTTVFAVELLATQSIPTPALYSFVLVRGKLGCLRDKSPALIPPAEL